MSRPPKYDWTGTVLPAAAAFVETFDTGVTLRQCFYYLGSRLIGGFTLTTQDYGLLSSWTTRARDEHRFPDFLDNTRRIVRPATFVSPDHAHEFLRAMYRRDRIEYADTSIYLGVEKAGLVEQLRGWFGDQLGIPILPLGGWSSQTFRETVRREIEKDGRPAVLIYAGDFDPAGVLIGDSFRDKSAAFASYIRVGLNIDQILDLPRSPFPQSKAQHSLIPRFKATYGRQLAAMGLPDVVQYEIDALSPAALRGLYQAAIDQFFDTSAYDRSIAQEASDLAEIERRWSAA